MQSGSPVALPGSCPRRLRRAGRRPAGGRRWRRWSGVWARAALLSGFCLRPVSCR